MKKSSTSTVPPFFQQDEDNHFDSQLERVYESFFDSPKTMKEVDKSIGIMRESICWFCRTLRKEDKLYPIRKRICTVTNHRATEYTTNTAYAPIRQAIQLSLFDSPNKTLSL